VEQLRGAWDAGDAVLPVDLRLAPPARHRLLAATRPACCIGENGTVALDSPWPTEDGDALVMATSGTTGEPKGSCSLATPSPPRLVPRASAWASTPRATPGGRACLSRTSAASRS